MAADPIARAEFTAIVQRLDAADNYRDTRLDAHIAEYRREAANMEANIHAVNAKVDGIDGKVDELLRNQANIKGRDGVVLILILALVNVCVGVIVAALAGLI